MVEPAAETAANAEAAHPSTPEPKPLSDTLASSLESLKKKPANASPTESELRERERVKQTVKYKIDEAKANLLRAMKFQVPRRFEGRVSWDALHKLLSREGRKAMGYCQAWAATPDRTPGPLLMGKSGTFKTHLLWATALEINRRANARVEAHASELWAKAQHEIDRGAATYSHSSDVESRGWPGFNLVTTDGAEIAHEVRASVDRKNLDTVIGRLRHEGWEPNKAVLMVDDVEVMKLSDWLHEELYRVFDYRYQESLPIFVATNLNAEELRKHLGDRIARRILDMTEPFVL